MRLAEAAEVVLRESGHPMRCKEIIARALEMGIWKTDGRTPADTLSAEFSTHIAEGGKVFARVARGLYGLRSNGDPKVVEVHKTKKTHPRMTSEGKGLGYVYVLTNKSLRGLVKIGRTEKGKIKDRLCGLNTSVPFDFEVVRLFLTSDYKTLEDHVHANLARNGKQVGSNKKKEFFRCTPYDAEVVIRRMANDLKLFDGKFVEWKTRGR